MVCSGLPLNPSRHFPGIFEDKEPAPEGRRRSSVYPDCGWARLQLHYGLGIEGLLSLTQIPTNESNHGSTAYTGLPYIAAQISLKCYQKSSYMSLCYRESFLSRMADKVVRCGLRSLWRVGSPLDDERPASSCHSCTCLQSSEVFHSLEETISIRCCKDLYTS